MGSGECFFCEIILFLRRDMFQCIQHRGAPSVCPIIHSGMMAGSLERKINVIKWTRHLPKKTFAIHMAQASRIAQLHMNNFFVLIVPILYIQRSKCVFMSIRFLRVHRLQSKTNKNFNRYSSVLKFGCFYIYLAFIKESQPVRAIISVIIIYGALSKLR